MSKFSKQARNIGELRARLWAIEGLFIPLYPWPRGALFACLFLFVPSARARPLEWALWNGTKGRGECSCDVGVVVLFTALAMATGQRPAKTRLVSLDSVARREAAGTGP
ncbi:hypothetical protein DPEC_G00086340 [Dallia pectoralis]|uniref:Uncharacterized protein n=1 Tax=Dallia pectoralis TaxID=75939 RepID=A0ACC2GZQ6_DALPE|nr:hypothetical protein DPEC_G00086340 [Dallia pectoralis]